MTLILILLAAWLIVGWVVRALVVDGKTTRTRLLWCNTIVAVIGVDRGGTLRRSQQSSQELKPELASIHLVKTNAQLASEDASGAHELSDSNTNTTDHLTDAGKQGNAHLAQHEGANVDLADANNALRELSDSKDADMVGHILAREASAFDRFESGIVVEQHPPDEVVDADYLNRQTYDSSQRQTHP